MSMLNYTGIVENAALCSGVIILTLFHSMGDDCVHPKPGKGLVIPMKIPLFTNVYTFCGASHDLE